MQHAARVLGALIPARHFTPALLFSLVCFLAQAVMAGESSINPLRNQTPLTTFSRNLRKKEVFPYVLPCRPLCVYSPNILEASCGGVARMGPVPRHVFALSHCTMAIPRLGVGCPHCVVRATAFASASALSLSCIFRGVFAVQLIRHVRFLDGILGRTLVSL